MLLSEQKAKSVKGNLSVRNIAGEDEEFVAAPTENISSDDCNDNKTMF